MLIGSLCIMMILGGCDAKYERDTSTGELVPITYQEYQDKRATEKGPYMVLITQTYCSYCKEYKENVLSDYLPNHGVEIYELNLTNEENPETSFTNLQKELKDDFEGTPTTIIFEDGEIKDIESGVLEEDVLDDYVTKYQLDKK